MSSSSAANLAALDAALRLHDINCPFPVKLITMAPFEKERLGWDEYRGIPIEADNELPTGRFVLVCDGSAPPADEIEDLNVVSPERELVTA